jgi:NTE family protein
MADPIKLKGKEPEVDPARIGISYSGGGPLVLVELGIARAFVQKGIRPHVITGASAGAIAAAAHALDPVGGKGIDLAADLLARVDNDLLNLTPIHFVGRVIVEREHTRSLGDNAPIGPLIKRGLRRYLNRDDVITMGFFKPPTRTELMIVATDVINHGAVWFPDDTPLDEALVASSAIPGVFPWRHMTINGQEMTLVDGGVISNQPLSNLVERGCGTLYACAVGPTGSSPEPENGFDNAMRAANLSMRQATKLEEDYVRLKLEPTGRVHHIHPMVEVPTDKFDFSPELVRAVMDEACEKTLEWWSQPHAD